MLQHPQALTITIVKEYNSVGNDSLTVFGRNFKDISDRRFNHLVAMRPTRKSPSSGLIIWLCVCDCKNEIEVVGADLRRETTVSCGCKSKEFISKANSTHGKSKTEEYKIFAYVKYRCGNRRCKDYENYGGRGIVVEWTTFEDFLADMGPRPGPKYSIERRNNDGPYSKTNCYWATNKEQSRNKRKTIYLSLGGIRKPLAQWAEELSFSRAVLYGRYRAKWTDERILTEGIHVKHRGKNGV